MRPTQVEAWALSVVDNVLKGHPIEDSRVEAKANWPMDSNQAARRIAGHANAAAGEPILWLIGVDERGRSVTGADKKEMANWFPSVESQFNNQLAPSVICDLNVHYDDKTLVALLFETSRAPYVVKNQMFGKQDGGSVSLEVPWRHGTSIRSATRSDLIRLLLPLEQLPHVKTLGLHLRANIADTDALGWCLDMKIYIVSRTKGKIVFPFHSCSASVDIGGNPRHVEFNKVLLEPFPRAVPGQSGSLTVHGSPTEIIVDGAGMAVFTGYGRSTRAKFGDNIGDVADVRVELSQAHDPRSIALVHSIKSNTGPLSSTTWGTWGTTFR